MPENVRRRPLSVCRSLVTESAARKRWRKKLLHASTFSSRPSPSFSLEPYRTFHHFSTLHITRAMKYFSSPISSVLPSVAVNPDCSINQSTRPRDNVSRAPDLRGSDGQQENSIPWSIAKIVSNSGVVVSSLSPSIKLQAGPSLRTRSGEVGMKVGMNR